MGMFKTHKISENIFSVDRFLNTIKDSVYDLESEFAPFISQLNLVRVNKDQINDSIDNMFKWNERFLRDQILSGVFNDHQKNLFVLNLLDDSRNWMGSKPAFSDYTFLSQD